MLKLFFVSDIHGCTKRYKSLFEQIKKSKPDALFIGGDILPAIGKNNNIPGMEESFLDFFLIPSFIKLKQELKENYPEVFIILGNDDMRIKEAIIINAASKEKIWHYIHNMKLTWKDYTVYGYSYVPPSPLQLKDWERFDVSRYLDPGCTAPYEGYLTIPVNKNILEWKTIKEDLDDLCENNDLSKSIFLFHAPPYQTNLDRADLEGKKIENVDLDPHIGSIAIKRFIEDRNPLITMHGHVHESAFITGKWQDKINNTLLFSAAHNGKELALIEILIQDKNISAKRLLI